MNHLSLAALAAIVLSCAGAARAEDPDAPVSTADTAVSAAPTAVATNAPQAPAPAPLTTAQQVDAFIRSSPASLPDDSASGVISGAEEPRKVHGVVDLSVGTGGYRSAYARSDLPLGKTGTLSIAVGETKFGKNGWAWGGGYPYGGGYGYPYRGTSQSLALGLRLGDSASSDGSDRCRLAWSDRRLGADQLLPPAPADRFSGCPYPPDDALDAR